MSFKERILRLWHFTKKSKLHTGTALICSLAIVFSALPVYATDTIDNLQNQTSALENELKGINQDILTLSEKISDTEMQVEILNSDIDKTQDDLEKAQKNEDQQYEDMKAVSNICMSTEVLQCLRCFSQQKICQIF